MAGSVFRAALRRRVWCRIVARFAGTRFAHGTWGGQPSGLVRGFGYALETDGPAARVAHTGFESEHIGSWRLELPAVSFVWRGGTSPYLYQVPGGTEVSRYGPRSWLVETGESRTPRPETSLSGCTTGLSGGLFLLARALAGGIPRQPADKSVAPVIGVAGIASRSNWSSASRPPDLLVADVTALRRPERIDVRQLLGCCRF